MRPASKPLLCPRSCRKLGFPGPVEGQQGCGLASPPARYTQEGQWRRKINSGPGKKRRFFPSAGISINHMGRIKGLGSKGSCPASLALLPEAGEQLPTGPTGQRGDSAAPARAQAERCGEV